MWTIKAFLLIFSSICSIVVAPYKLLYSKKEIIKYILIEKMQNKRIGEWLKKGNISYLAVLLCWQSEL